MSSSFPRPDQHNNPHLQPPPNSVTPISASSSVSSLSIEKDHGTATVLTPAPAYEKPEDHGDGIDSEDTHISFRNVERVTVKARGLGIEVRESKGLGKKKNSRKEKTLDEEEGKDEGVRILRNVNVDFPSGELVGIIGSSGSGKTSLLNVMSHRMRGKNINVSGTTIYNDTDRLSDIRHAYVMQADVLPPRLTVRETLRYSASLRLPATTTAQERNSIVEEVILQLGLKDCASTLIGDSHHAGCSGGEKRRVSIGIQLLTNPSLLFLDEPTTGLDATSAHQLVRTLKNLARKGRTVITTLHQPRSEIWSLLDRIVLLARGGEVLFAGRAEEVVPYFTNLGWPLPEHVNPADWLIDLAAIDYRSPEAEEASIARVQSLTAEWRANEEYYLDRGVDKELDRKPSTRRSADLDRDMNALDTGAHRTPLLRQISVLTKREFVTTYRDPMGITGTMFLGIGMSVICGWVFYKLDGSVPGIRSRMAALYIAASMHAYLMLLFETYRLCHGDMAIFDREHGEGVVGVFAFLFSRRVAKFVTEDFVVPFLFSAIYYFMVGLDADPGKFFLFFSVVLLTHYINVAFATLAVSISREFPIAVLICNLAYTIVSMACGFFIQASTMPVYVRWTKYICFIWYSFGALAANEFTDAFYDCPLPGGRDNPACTEYDGNYVLRTLDFPRNWTKIPITVDLAYAVGFYLLAGVVLKWKPVDITVVKGSKKADDDIDQSAGKEKLTKREGMGEEKIDVTLEDYKLRLKKRGIFGKGALNMEILKGVSAKFEAGKLNVIMGPSGSGKSSLLNLMARRLRSSLMTRYTASGQMLLNGTSASDGVIRSLCSYVTQDDNALLPNLTVREMIHYAALLRLPQDKPYSEKIQRAEEVLLKLGLKDCADVLIGSEFKKGISGGQKRRVTVAIQILTEPVILLLDEPTSGLDAFTAASILSVLSGLASEGRTIICTIHQSRSDLFQHFGNILLLARGGHTVFSGPADSMLPYFSKLGHDCPTSTNPADFALDLVTIDLQHASREAHTRATVQNLIASFTPLHTAPTTSLPIPTHLARVPAGFLTAFPLLLRRSIRAHSRAIFPLLSTRVFQIVGLGTTLTLFFTPLRHDFYSIQNRFGFLQQILPLYFVGMLQNIATYTLERDIFYSEHDDGAYGVMPFLLHYMSLEIPFELIAGGLFAILADLAVGLPRTGKMYSVVLAVAVCVTNCGESIGIVFNTLTDHSGFSVNAMSTVISIFTIMAGVMSSNMPNVLKGINYISPPRYAARALAVFGMEGVGFYCKKEQLRGDGTCPVETGEQALALYRMQDEDGAWNLAVCVAITVSYRIVAMLVVKAKRERWF